MSTVLHRLGALGATYNDPVAAIDWSKSEPDQPWLPPDLLSLAGLGLQADMPRDVLLRLSQVEFARLCAAGLWLEGLLIGRVAATGFLAAETDETRVMLQEVREESGHGLMFLEMIERAGLSGVPLLGPTRLLTEIAQRLDPKGPAFWAMVYIGESVTDTYALKALKASGTEEICPVARQVLYLHHRDEARHIAAARAFLDTRISNMGHAKRLIFRQLLNTLLKRFLFATLYPTAASLQAMGMANANGAAAAARACPERLALANSCAASARDLIERTSEA